METTSWTSLRSVTPRSSVIVPSAGSITSVAIATMETMNAMRVTNSGKGRLRVGGGIYRVGPVLAVGAYAEVRLKVVNRAFARFETYLGRRLAACQ